MIDIHQQAAFHRAALLLGLTKGETVVAWADHLIATDAELAPLLLDLSLVPPHDLSELRHALEPLSARSNSLPLIRALFDIARRDVVTGERSAHDTVTVLMQARSFLKLPDDYAAAIQQFTGDHMLALAGVRGDVAEVEQRVVNWLAQFEYAETEFFEESRC